MISIGPSETCVGTAISMPPLPSMVRPAEGDQSAARSTFESMCSPPAIALMKPSPWDRSMTRWPPVMASRALGSTVIGTPVPAEAVTPRLPVKLCSSRREPPAWPRSTRGAGGCWAVSPTLAVAVMAPVGGISRSWSGGLISAPMPASNRAPMARTSDHAPPSGMVSETSCVAGTRSCAVRPGGLAAGSVLSRRT